MQKVIQLMRWHTASSYSVCSFPLLHDTAAELLQQSSYPDSRHCLLFLTFCGHHQSYPLWPPSVLSFEEHRHSQRSSFLCAMDSLQCVSCFSFLGSFLYRRVVWQQNGSLVSTIDVRQMVLGKICECCNNVSTFCVPQVLHNNEACPLCRLQPHQRFSPITISWVKLLLREYQDGLSSWWVLRNSWPLHPKVPSRFHHVLRNIGGSFCRRLCDSPSWRSHLFSLHQENACLSLCQHHDQSPIQPFDFLS